MSKHHFLKMVVILFSIFTLSLVFCYLTTSFVSTAFGANISFTPLTFFQKQNSDVTRKIIKVHDILKKKLIISKTKKTVIIYDHRIALPYGYFGLKNLHLGCFLDNSSQYKFDQTPDYIITHSEGVEQMTEGDFEKWLQKRLSLPSWSTPEV